MLPIVNSLKEATNAFYRNSTATLWAKREDGTEKQVFSLKEAKLFYNNIDVKHPGEELDSIAPYTL